MKNSTSVLAMSDIKYSDVASILKWDKVHMLYVYIKSKGVGWLYKHKILSGELVNQADKILAQYFLFPYN